MSVERFIAAIDERISRPKALREFVRRDAAARAWVAKRAAKAGAVKTAPKKRGRA